ncbi:DUF6093 family protein [Arthrobacter sp. GMC3]|uniref:DUF6093 family protein n=1 Tax=Arthrobacter sp. GMC3 TaxID=2058894 RepID=UPI000CE37313|nr:DUF6093 family protein [Arthrobacter sp. GMC3]
MNIEGEIRAGRRLAERLMIDKFRFTRAVIGPPIRDEATGDLIYLPPVLVYEGKGKVQTYEAHEVGIGSAGRLFTVQRYQIHVPVGPERFMIGDVAECIKATLDPALLGREYVVAALLHKTAATARRLQVDEVAA